LNCGAGEIMNNMLNRGFKDVNEMKKVLLVAIAIVALTVVVISLFAR
jgi:cell division protein FtsL